MSEGEAVHAPETPDEIHKLWEDEPVRMLTELVATLNLRTDALCAAAVKSVDPDDDDVIALIRRDSTHGCMVSAIHTLSELADLFAVWTEKPGEAPEVGF